MLRVAYFSGTGNSLYIAKAIAKNLNGEIYDITNDLNNNSITIEDEHLIIVSPMHHHGLPRYVRNWISRLLMESKTIIDLVITYGFNIGKTEQEAKTFFEKNNLYLRQFHSIKMIYNYVIPTKFIKMFSSFKLKEYQAEEKNNVNEIAEKELERVIRELSSNKKEIKNKTNKHKPTFLHDSMHKNAWLKIIGYNGPKPKTFDDAISLMDYAFNVDSNCNGCNICAKICSFDNIVIKENKPVWKHNCEQCFACLQWCPKQAIQFRGNTVNQPRYHNQKVELREMIKKY